jgi:phosphohistidine phosphatase
MIWLLRHGQAAADADDDASRRLTAKGERQARAAGRALAVLGVELDACLSSPKARAIATATLACESLAVEPEVDERLAGGRDPLEPARGRGEVLVVGHEPDLSAAVAEVSGASVAIKKGGIAGLGGGRLLVLARPRELEQIARR